jgi:uncharacterized protein (TIGR02246 family)
MDNKEILVKANAAITRGDYEKFLSYCTDDTQWTFVGEQVLRGKEAVRQYMKEAYSEPPKFSVENLIGENDFVTAVGIISMKGEDGKQEEYSYCDVWRFEGGKMAQLKAFVIKSEE